MQQNQMLQASVAPPLKSFLKKIPYEVCGQRGSDNRSSIAEKVDEFIQVFDLQPIVKRIPEPMCPVEKWE
jgi:hypothetical protein